MAVTAMKSDGGTAMTMESALYGSQRNDLNSRNLLEFNDREMFPAFVEGYVQRGNRGRIAHRNNFGKGDRGGSCDLPILKMGNNEPR